MIRYSNRIKLLAAGLAALAGFVDATGFIKAGGFFISFMSGNTTRLAVGLASGTSPAAIAGGLIGVFVLGVVVGTISGHFAGRHRAAFVLAVVSALLAVGACFGAGDFSICAIVAMTLAMGAINAVFVHDGEVHIGLTYMTGTLVKIGQRIASAILGADPLAWWPYFLLWFGLATGATVGALVYPYLGLNSLWLAALAAALFSFIAAKSDLGQQQQS